MFPTPITSHIDAEKVYEPAEDSFLLLDTFSVSTEIAFLTERFNQLKTNAAGEPAKFPAPLVVEIGTGSGVILAFLTAHARVIFGRDDLLTVGTDVNSYACRVSQTTVTRAVDEAFSNDAKEISPINKTPGTAAGYLGSLVADLCAPFRSGLVDVLVFNPPYVPTASLPRLDTIDSSINSGVVECSDSFLEHESDLLAFSYAGGLDGMEITKRLLAELDVILHPQRGVAYVLLCAQNKPESVKSDLLRRGWAVETVSRSGANAGWEKLQVIRISR